MNKDMVVYLTLLLCGIVFAIIALFAMMNGPDYFSIIFAAYMLGYSIYMTVMLFRVRNDENEKAIATPTWVTLFTVFLSVLLAGMAVIMLFQRKKGTNTSTLYAPYQSSNPAYYQAKPISF